MKYETLHGLTIPKIGFGTWKIGGGSNPEPRTDSVSKAALRSALELGYIHFDTAEMYAGGHAEELLGEVVREVRVDRATLFITSKVMPAHLRFEQVLKSCEDSLRRLQMEYLDLYLIHWPQAGMKLPDTFRALNTLVRSGKVKHLGVSNFDLKLLDQSRGFSESPIITNQVPFSLAERSYIKNGMLEYCQQNEILLTAYSPIDEGNLKSSGSLGQIAKAHNATKYQIALAWICSHPRVVTIPMSANKEHQKENFEAADIMLSAEELASLTG